MITNGKPSFRDWRRPVVLLGGSGLVVFLFTMCLALGRNSNARRVGPERKVRAERLLTKMIKANPEQLGQRTFELTDQLSDFFVTYHYFTFSSQKPKPLEITIHVYNRRAAVTHCSDSNLVLPSLK